MVKAGCETHIQGPSSQGLHVFLGPGLSGCHFLLLPPSSLATCPPPPFPTDPGSSALPLGISVWANPILSSPLAANWKPGSSLVSAWLNWASPQAYLIQLSICKNERGHIRAQIQAFLEAPKDLALLGPQKQWQLLTRKAQVTPSPCLSGSLASMPQG